MNKMLLIDRNDTTRMCVSSPSIDGDFALRAESAYRRSEFAERGSILCDVHAAPVTGVSYLTVLDASNRTRSLGYYLVIERVEF